MGKRVSTVLAMLVFAGVFVSCLSSKKPGTEGSADASKGVETAAPSTEAQGQTAATPAHGDMDNQAPGTGEHAIATMTNDKGEMVVVGNAICPISGHEVKPNGYAMMYNGKKVNLCCPDCVEGFEKDPQAAAKKAGAI